MLNDSLKSRVIERFENVTLAFLFPPLLVGLSLFCTVLGQGENYSETYVNVQKDLFFYLNRELSVFPELELNLTQMGDVLIVFPMLSILLIYAPRFWEVLLTSSLLSLVSTYILKNIFLIQRPASIFGEDNIAVIGELLNGHNSTPSGHSTTMFIVGTLLLIAFMPQKKIIYKIFWTLFVLFLTLFFASSRVGVGAHHPFDVVAGACLGTILSILSVKIVNKVRWFSWICSQKMLPVFGIGFAFWAIFIIKKIIEEKLPIYYISLFALFISLYLLTKICLKRN